MNTNRSTSLAPFFIISLILHLLFFIPMQISLKGEAPAPKEKISVTILEPPSRPAPSASKEINRQVPLAPPPSAPGKGVKAKEEKIIMKAKAPDPSPELPQPEPKFTFQEIPIDQRLIDLGRKWLKDQDKTFPELIAQYQSGLGFTAYADYMQRLGGRFFVRDLDAQRLRAELDLKRDRLIPVAMGSLGSLSPRSRALDDEPKLQRFLHETTRLYGPARYGTILLVPFSVDATIMGGIEESLRKTGRKPEQLLVIEGRYRRKGDHLILEILTGKSKSGETVRLNLALNLSEAARIALR